MLKSFAITILATIALLPTVHAQLLVTAGTNITSGNTPLEGINNADYSHLGTIYTQFEGTGFGASYSLIDNDYTYGFDTTYSDSFQGRSSFAGIEGSNLVTATTASPLTYLQVTFRLFGDGGWFGPNNYDSDPGTLLPTELTAPVLQTTTDGTNWTTVGSVTDYVAQLTGNGKGNNNSNTVTFALTTPASDIYGIRVIGSSGGVAGGDNGFVGFTEFTAYSGGVLSVPEPSTYALALMGAGLLAFFGLRYRRA